MELASIMDLFPTIANLVGAKMPNVTIDGIDMAPILFKNSKVCKVLGDKKRVFQKTRVLEKLCPSNYSDEKHIY